jgi:hypothetical protein
VNLRRRSGGVSVGNMPLPIAGEVTDLPRFKASEAAPHPDRRYKIGSLSRDGLRSFEPNRRVGAFFDGPLPMGEFLAFQYFSDFASALIA